MKTAKFAAFCLLAVICFAIASRPAAIVGTGESSARYVRADSRSVYFCVDMDDDTALFAIPYTYCAELLATVGDWYYVKYAEDDGKYQALYGYCRKEGMTPVSEPPENVYLNMTVTVTFKQESINPSLPALSELSVAVAFYGTYYSGASAYSYVLYDGNFGYVYGANDDYPLNEIPDEKPPAEEPSKGANIKLILIIVLIAAAVIALVILYFTGRTAKFKRLG
ncbi:MAG: hypothetical protein K2J83_03265 [Clostridia bacterium]|nr:hypothetical protein [Clostridia bacterium]